MTSPLSMSRLRVWHILVFAFIFSGCAGAGAFHSLNTTTVELSQPNYRVIARGITGQGSSWYLLGASTGYQTAAMFRLQGTGMLHQEAVENLWKNFSAVHGKVEGRRLALTNVRFDAEALNTVLFVHPVVSVQADVIEFFEPEQAPVAQAEPVETPPAQVKPASVTEVKATPTPAVAAPAVHAAKEGAPVVRAEVAQVAGANGLKGEAGIPLNESGYTWIVASLPKLDDARKMADKYRGQGFRADVLTGNSGGKRAYRVAMGHFASLDEALEARTSLPKDVSDDPWTLRIK